MGYKVIGISGLAGSGKDLFFSLLQKKLPNVKRFALADSLKHEVRDAILKFYNIDILNCSREEKDLVRPFLVAHGKIRRHLSNGTHWTNILTEKINYELSNNSESIICVTDIRYDVFEKDEVSWLKDYMQGFLVHISLFEENNNEKVFLKAPNADEAENDPKLISKANLNIEWPKILTPSTSTENTDFSVLNPYVEKCITALQGR